MSAIKLGQVITNPDAPNKDAVHIAVARVTAATLIMPGARVAYARGHAFAVVGFGGVGVADPFLRLTIMKGQEFWLFLDPDTTTGLAHVWTHPAFTDDEDEEDTDRDDVEGRYPEDDGCRGCDN